MTVFDKIYLFFYIEMTDSRSNMTVLDENGLRVVYFETKMAIVGVKITI